jgi:hypothetical protein
MLSIVNKTGWATDTEIYDEKGNDITGLISCYKAEIGISPGELIFCKLYCYCKEIDFVKMELKDGAGFNKYSLHTIHNVLAMKEAGLSRIN